MYIRNMYHVYWCSILRSWLLLYCVSLSHKGGPQANRDLSAGEDAEDFQRHHHARVLAFAARRPGEHGGESSSSVDYHISPSLLPCFSSFNLCVFLLLARTSSPKSSKKDWRTLSRRSASTILPWSRWGASEAFTFTYHAPWSPNRPGNQ